MAVNAFAALIGALMSGGIAIWTFVVGNKKVKEREQEKEMERLRELKIYFETIVSILIDKPIEKQIKEILELTKKLKQRRFQHLEFQTQVNLHIDHIKQIEHRDLFAVYVSGRDIRLYTIMLQELMAELELIDSMRQTLERTFNALFENFKSFESDFHTNADGVSRLFTEEIQKAKFRERTSKDDPFLAGMQVHFQNWMHLQNHPSIGNYRDPYVVNDRLLVPIVELCDQYQKDQRAPVLANLIRQAKFALENFDELRWSYRRALIQSARQLVRSRVRIQKYLCNLREGSGYGLADFGRNHQTTL